MESDNKFLKVDFSFWVEALLRSQGWCEVVYVAVFSRPSHTLTFYTRYWCMSCGVVWSDVLVLHRNLVLTLIASIKQPWVCIFSVYTITLVHKHNLYQWRRRPSDSGTSAGCKHVTLQWTHLLHPSDLPPPPPILCHATAPCIFSRTRSLLCGLIYQCLEMSYL